MSFNVITTPRFEKSAKSLSKKYRSLKSDLKELISSLEQNPLQGVEISQNIRKIRLAIASKGRGKSGGARVITFTLLSSEIDGQVYLIDLYDKGEFSTVDVNIVRAVIADLELI